jgi:hypothetical protein
MTDATNDQMPEKEVKAAKKHKHHDEILAKLDEIVLMAGHAHTEVTSTVTARVNEIRELL